MAFTDSLLLLISSSSISFFIILPPPHWSSLNFTISTSITPVFYIPLTWLPPPPSPWGLFTLGFLCWLQDIHSHVKIRSWDHQIRENIEHLSFWVCRLTQYISQFYSFIYKCHDVIFLTSVLLLFYCSDSTPWPRQLVKVSILFGVHRHKRLRVHGQQGRDHGSRQKGMALEQYTG